MKIEVHHMTGLGLTHVATVDAPDNLTLEGALEYAWRWTNNVEGSWSIKEAWLSGQENGDFNERVEVTAPLHVDPAGKTWGHRSSMVGDIFVADGQRFRVDVFGFEPEEQS